LSFLRQIEILEHRAIFTRYDLFLTFDQGHLGNRFVLFDTILAFLVDQLIYEENFPLELKISREEINYILDFLGGVNNDIDELIEKIGLYLNGEDDATILKIIRKNLLSEKQQINRRLVFDFSGGRIFTTPFGYYWTTSKVNMNLNFSSHSAPALGPVSQTMDELEPLIHEWKIQNSLASNLQDLATLNTIGLNSLIIRFDKIAKIIPKKIRRWF
jgi:hypothetical protein